MVGYLDLLRKQAGTAPIWVYEVGVGMVQRRVNTIPGTQFIERGREVIDMEEYAPGKYRMKGDN